MNLIKFLTFFLCCIFFKSIDLLAEDPEFQAELQKHFGTVEGAILVVDPASGFVLGSLNADTFFLQKYPPGSLVKVFTLLAYRAEHGNKSPIFYCPASVANDPLGCWDRNGHGKLDAQSAIGFSCNVYFRQLAEQITPETFIRTLTDFGLISKRSDLPTSCMQDVMVGKTTEWQLYPALLLRAYSAFYNHGNLWGIKRGNVSAPRSFSYVQHDLLQLIRNGMYRSGRNGTSMQAAIQSGVEVLGKTGTSMVSQNGIANWRHTQGWWIGFYPDDKPRIAIMTFSPNGRGASDAAPLGGKVLSLYLERNGKHVGRAHLK